MECVPSWKEMRCHLAFKAAVEFVLNSVSTVVVQDELRRLQRASQLAFEAQQLMLKETDDIAELHRSSQQAKKHHLNIFLAFFEPKPTCRSSFS